jgi:hypothetical protein
MEIEVSFHSGMLDHLPLEYGISYLNGYSPLLSVNSDYIYLHSDLWLK